MLMRGFLQLWDVAKDQDAVDIARKYPDPQKAARALVEHALKESTDNITVIVVRFPPSNPHVQSGSNTATVKSGSGEPRLESKPESGSGSVTTDGDISQKTVAPGGST